MSTDKNGSNSRERRQPLHRPLGTARIDARGGCRNRPAARCGKVPRRSPPARVMRPLDGCMGEKGVRNVLLLEIKTGQNYL